MTKILNIVKAKPNPFGKDKSHGNPLPEQLLGEWVDIKNVGTEAVPFSSMSLSHTLFDNRCNSTGRVEAYWSWNASDSSLKAGQTIRVHTGKITAAHLTKPEDKSGSEWDGYANRDNFVLNNACGDIVTVTWSNSSGISQKDTVSYDRNVPEGAILQRSGNKLVQVIGYYR